MVALLDVNVLIALAWPNHVHHRAARDWFARNSSLGWATCSVTQAGFIRISANRKVMGEAKTPADARQLLRRIVALHGHQFWSDDIALVDSELIDDSKVLGYRQVSDAHLLAMVIRHSGRLATLDRKIFDLVPTGFAPERVVDWIL